MVFPWSAVYEYFQTTTEFAIFEISEDGMYIRCYYECSKGNTIKYSNTEDDWFDNNYPVGCEKELTEEEVFLLCL